MITIHVRCTNSACGLFDLRTAVTIDKSPAYLMPHVKQLYCPLCREAMEEAISPDQPQQPASVVGTVQSIVAGNNTTLSGITMVAGASRTEKR